MLILSLNVRSHINNGQEGLSYECQKFDLEENYKFNYKSTNIVLAYSVSMITSQNVQLVFTRED